MSGKSDPYEHQARGQASPDRSASAKAERAKGRRATKQPDYVHESLVKKPVLAPDNPLAACFSIDKGLFDDASSERAAKAVCRLCVLRKPCLQEEILMPSAGKGVRGMMTEQQRDMLRNIMQLGLTPQQQQNYEALKTAEAARRQAEIDQSSLNNQTEIS